MECIASSLLFLSARRHARHLSAVSPAVRMCVNEDVPNGACGGSTSSSDVAPRAAGCDGEGGGLDATPQLLAISLWWCRRQPKTSLAIHNASDDVLEAMCASSWSSTLTSLDVSCAWSFNDSSVKWLKPLLHLTKLNIGNTRVSDQGLFNLLPTPAMRRLSSLCVAHCRQFTDVGLRHVVQFLPMLEHLDVQCTAISDGGLASVGASVALRCGLKVLNASGCGITDASFEALSHLTVLESLYLARCRVRPPPPSATMTEQRDVGGAASPPDGTDAAPVVPPDASDRPSNHLGALQALRTLDLSGSAFCNQDASHLRPLRFCLQNLNLANCYELSDRGLMELMELFRLRSLNVCGVAVTRPTALLKGLVKALPSLEMLLLSECCHHHRPQRQRHTTPSILPDDDALALFDSEVGFTVANTIGFRCLTDLNLRGCDYMDDALRSIHTLLPALTALDVSRCRMLTNVAMSYIGQVASLRALHASDLPRITDDGVLALRGLSRLTSLDVSQCTISNRSAIAIAQQHHQTLEHLVVRDCIHIDDVGVSELANGLTAHAASVIHGGAPHDNDVAAAVGHRLTTLVLSGCSLTDTGIAALLDVAHSLTVLDLRGCSDISDDGVLQLSGFTALKVLLLARCRRLTDACMGVVEGMRDLEELNVSGCADITDAGLRAFARAHAPTPSSRLQALDLSFCPRITNTGCGYLKCCHRLRRLNVSGTRCTKWGLQQLMLELPQLHDILVPAQR